MKSTVCSHDYLKVEDGECGLRYIQLLGFAMYRSKMTVVPGAKVGQGRRQTSHSKLSNELFHNTKMHGSGSSHRFLSTLEIV
jgi:hypothetical protein